MSNAITAMQGTDDGRATDQRLDTERLTLMSGTLMPPCRYLSSQVRQFDGQVFCSSGWGWLIQDCVGICGGTGRRAKRSGWAA